MNKFKLVYFALGPELSLWYCIYSENQIFGMSFFDGRTFLRKKLWLQMFYAIIPKKLTKTIDCCFFHARYFVMESHVSIQFYSTCYFFAVRNFRLCLWMNLFTSHWRIGLDRISYTTTWFAKYRYLSNSKSLEPNWFLACSDKTSFARKIIDFFVKCHISIRTSGIQPKIV